MYEPLARNWSHDNVLFLSFSMGHSSMWTHSLGLPRSRAIRAVPAGRPASNHQTVLVDPEALRAGTNPRQRRVAVLYWA